MSIINFIANRGDARPVSSHSSRLSSDIFYYEQKYYN